jgi:hypothetical protein
MSNMYAFFLAKFSKLYALRAVILSLKSPLTTLPGLTYVRECVLPEATSWIRSDLVKITRMHTPEMRSVPCAWAWLFLTAPIKTL